jgi:thiamine-phosphate diphosphorylase
VNTTIQFITPQPQRSNVFFDLIQSSLDQGITWIQYRNKIISDIELNFEIASKVSELCKLYNATLIVNDDINLAMMIDATGVHLGRNDVNISLAQDVFGRHKLYGASSNSITDIQNAIQTGFNYTGLGPFKRSTTKLNTSPELGLNKIKEILTLANTDFPIVLIGGLDLDDILQLKLLGVKYFALSSTIVKLVKSKKLKLLLDAVNG